MERHIAIYVRVSRKRQDTRSQEPDLKRWEGTQDEPVRWYVDKSSGKSMNRPAWNELEAAIDDGQVSRVVVWRIDRLGRTAKGLTALFSDLQERGVGLLSLKDSLDLSTPAGRLMANVLASVAQFETEVRGERIAAGQEAARAAGKRWGGSPAGKRKKVQPRQERSILKMHKDGVPVATIARATGLSRPTIYNVIHAGKEAASA